MTAATRKPRPPKVVAPTVAPPEMVDEAAATAPAEPAKTKAVRCSHFIVKRDRQCKMMTHHADGICTDHRAVWAPKSRS